MPDRGVLVARSMPTVLRHAGSRFFFYSDEGREPAHVHVEVGDDECKFWLEPVSLARNLGFKPKELRAIERLLVENQALILAAWREQRSQE